MPIFLPFAGCPARCLYCAQDLQTARGLPRLASVLEGARAMLEQRAREGREPCEAAFYGGTFAAQAEENFSLCLEAAGLWLGQGLICSWRCSTRPDRLDGSRLEAMRSSGCGCIELGIQSFADTVLKASGRGYNAADAVRGMDQVRAAGFACGVQLLPGLPGSTPELFLRDVRLALERGCALLRFYPCLVVRSTGLARLYEQGLYQPWDVPSTVEALARGLVLASAALVPVTRLGVAHEEDFERHVLTGPRDAHLGTRVRSRALLLALEGHVPRGGRLKRVWLPRHVQGYLYGQGGEARQGLAALGLTKEAIAWHDGAYVAGETS